MKPRTKSAAKYATVAITGVAFAGALTVVPNPLWAAIADNDTSVEEVGVARKPLADLQDLVNSNTQIFVGKIAATNANALEVVPSASEEGVLPGEGADIYGTITFSPSEMLKGPIAKEVRVAFESGKRDPAPGKSDRIISYTYESLKEVQNVNGKLKAPREIKETYVAFISPNDGYYPPGAGTAVLDPVGLAVLQPDGTLKFDGKPFAKGNQHPTLDELRRLTSNARN